MKLHAHFLNENSTLIIDWDSGQSGGRLAIPTTTENMADCWAIARGINALVEPPPIQPEATYE